MAGTAGKKLAELISLHQKLCAEREAILARIGELNASMDKMGITATERFYGLTTPSGRPRNRMTLREVTIEVLRRHGKPMTKDQVLSAILATGYQFSTKDPLNSLGVVLYGKNSGITGKRGKFELENT